MNATWITVWYGFFNQETMTIASGMERMALEELPEWLADNAGCMITKIQRS